MEEIVTHQTRSVLSRREGWRRSLCGAMTGRKGREEPKLTSTDHTTHRTIEGDWLKKEEIQVGTMELYTDESGI